jgi:hypothetical protein
MRQSDRKSKIDNSGASEKDVQTVLARKIYESSIIDSQATGTS